MNKTINRFIGIALASLMIFSFLPMTVATTHAAGNDRQISYTYGDEFQFDKISNPGAGSGMADGINTGDETGYSANRLNSYACAVAARGDYNYIGTNRTLFEIALNAVEKIIAQMDSTLLKSKDVWDKLKTIIFKIRR